MRKDSTVLAILLADIHLSLKAPIWRSAEDDWFEVQARTLRQVQLLQERCQCPVICAGDIFDRNKKISDGWDAPPELINFALDELPDGMYAIPGQHDLPNHQYADKDRSAYWTLVKAGKIKNISTICGTNIGLCLRLYAFPPGFTVVACVDFATVDPGRMNIAVAHQYRCLPGKDYTGAPDGAYICRRENNLCGYDVIVYGDNHKGFTADVNLDATVFNCGTLMRRKSDEIDYEPQVGLLLETGKVVAHKLDVSQDKYIDTIKAESQNVHGLDMEDFFEELEKLGDSAINFKESMLEFLRSKKTSAGAKEVIIKAMEKSNVQI